MSPKDTPEFDAEDDIIELTDIVEHGTPPASAGAEDLADDLFDAGGDEVDFEKELEDLFTNGNDAAASPGASAKDADEGLDFEADLDDLLGSLDADDSPPAVPSSAKAAASPSASSPADDDDDFAAELDDLLGGLDSTGPAAQTTSPADEDDMDADLDALLGSLDDVPAKPAKTSQTSRPAPAMEEVPDDDVDDLLSELGLAPEPAPATEKAPTPAAKPRKADADADIDFSELDALIEGLEVPQGKTAPAPAEDDGLPDLSDLDSLLQEAAGQGPSSGTVPADTDEADNADSQADMDDLDSLLDSLQEPVQAAGEDVPAPAAVQPPTDEAADDLDAFLNSLGDDDDQNLPQDAAPAPAPAAKDLPFDPNESLDAPDMDDLDALLGDLGGPEQPAHAPARPIESANAVESAVAAESADAADLADAALAEDDEDIPDLDEILAAGGEAAPAGTGTADTGSARTAEPDPLDELEALLGSPDAPDMAAAQPEDLPTGLPTGLHDDLPGDVPDDLANDLANDLAADLLGDAQEHMPEADIDALLADLDDITPLDAEAPLSDTSLLADDEDSPDSADFTDPDDMLAGGLTLDDLSPADAAPASPDAFAAASAPDMQSLLQRIAALEAAARISEESVEDIVARKIAEAAAEEEACTVPPAGIHAALEEALAENGPVMERISAMLDAKIDARLSELEESMFTHKDWNMLGHELKDEIKSTLEKTAAKAAADIIREELAALLAEE